MIDPSAIRERFAAVGRGLNERARRLFAAVEARTAGLWRDRRIVAGDRDRAQYDRPWAEGPGRPCRAVGRGSPARQRPAGLTETDATLLEDLRQLLEPATNGRPDAAAAVGLEEPREAGGGAVCDGAPESSKSSIPKLLELLQYRRQVNRKTLESSRNPDRDAQFEHINAAVIATQAAGQPVISIDTKKKELIGPYKNAGSDYRPEGCPDQVKVHDFVDAELGKVVPYGVYDIAANAGCVSVGIDNDTAQFSVNSIRRWLDLMGRERYPDMPTD